MGLDQPEILTIERRLKARIDAMLLSEPYTDLASQLGVPDAATKRMGPGVWPRCHQAEGLDRGPVD